MTAKERLYELWGEISDLGSCEELLAWDQETYMPRAGNEGRGRLLSTLAGVKHERLTAPELHSVLAELAEAADSDPILDSQLREAERVVKRARKVPTSLARELALVSRLTEGWTAAQRALPSAELHATLREQQRADFPAGRTRRVRGWVLARTEARLAALAALSVSG